MGTWIEARSCRTITIFNPAVSSDFEPYGSDEGVPKMSPANLPADDSLPPEDLARVISICVGFETEWNARHPWRIERELALAGERIRDRLFRELLALEIELTRRDGRHADPDAYLARFPDQAHTVLEVFAAHNTATAPYPDETGEMIAEDSAVSPAGYDILRTLGKGGQATTFLARDRALKRLVVLKRYHGVASSGRREAVLNEGRALARVRSPFVAPCYGVETRGDEIDLVVEYIPGRPLTELTADDRADSGRSATLVEQVAGGLAEVHACGLLHRDIKPQNLILGDDGLPRLVDFGLAVPVASAALHRVAGSPPYMAPEQARGQGERIDARTDVYGLGAVLYYLLTGQPPHDGKTPVEAIEQARHGSIIPPRRINPRVPRALERICLKALAADPQSRFPSAEALRLALRRDRLTRRVAPVLGAVAVLLALVVPAWAFWPRSARPLSGGPNRAIALRGSTEPRAEPARPPQVDLRVTRFEIPHFPKLDAKHSDPKRAGTMGRSSFGAREDDEVTVRAELSEPAFAYLIAFRPDGTDELCDPDDDDTPPPKKRLPVYPPPAKSDERYRLSEGAGLHAFALVVSRQPLPSYRQWKQRIGPMAWDAKLPCEPGVVWRDDDQGLQPLVADDSAGTRGKGAKARDSGAPAAKLASWLRGLPGVDAVTLEAFSVEPASGP
jgi:tRNA A-37 threonylcarbamoyl transferase component Bud32